MWHDSEGRHTVGVCDEVNEFGKLVHFLMVAPRRHVMSQMVKVVS
jgi:hypothetical protein